jgi:carbamoyl-phosphate synthase large subunit
MADKIYFLPVTPYFVEKVIKKEQPDGILLTFGGQTALNCGVELHKKGIFKKNNVKVLGTQIQAIMDTEDRELFKHKLAEINAHTPKSVPATTIGAALTAAKEIGYPLMLRAAYALGGKGSGIINNKEELGHAAKKAFATSPQILIEEWLGGWKEVEYEVVRDKYDNCITVCNMENVDPLGIHTGESIVVAPSQTLTNNEYHKLRKVSIDVIRHIGVIGECNIQFALNPESEEYRIIEVNARLSRSSALASKATGYPLAFIAAKLALGYGLTEIENRVTKQTKSCFEPALDYIVIKIPRWDLKKFRRVKKEIGSEMKSVGEVMAIGRSFEETLQKAIRMLGIGMHGVVGNRKTINNIEKELAQPTDERLFAVAAALKSGSTVDNIHAITKIDKWFLWKIKNIVDTEAQLKQHTTQTIPSALMKQAKKQGFSDFQIARCITKRDNMDTRMLEVRVLRKKMNVIPVVKQIDTLAAEFPAQTNYLYLTYNGEEDDITFEKEKKAIVLGSGAYRIGSSVEFDWCCVNTVFTLRKLNYKTIMINYNPETVSTDYDVCDKLYFDELSFERVLDIYEKEDPDGLILSMGGQIPNNLAMRCYKENVCVLGTSPTNIDKAENRHHFSAMLDKLHIDQPEWIEASSYEEVEQFANRVGYPVLIRPSYVLSGAAMSVASNHTELQEYVKKATDVSKQHPTVVSKFITGAKEIEIDAVAQKGKIIIYALSEHIENAGVHSGDATLVLPPQYTYLETVRRIKEIAKRIAAELEITGPFNIQFIAKDNKIKVIECNLRASRSFPFVSKITKHNFIDIATKAMLNHPQQEYNIIDFDYVGVKAPQFSFARLHGADPILGVEMASTGEVGCIGKTIHEALMKSLLSVGFRVPQKGVLLSTGPIKSKTTLLESSKKLAAAGFKLYATTGTHDFLKQHNVLSIPLHWPHTEQEPNALTYIRERKIDLVINIPKNYEEQELTNGYRIRRQAADFNVPLLTNAQLAKLFVDAVIQNNMNNNNLKDLEIKAWGEY